MNDKPSKSARKREARAIEALGERLLGLTDEQLDGLPLDDDLRTLLAATRQLKRSALRRQRLYLAKQLRHADTAAIAAALDAREQRRGDERRLFHRAEHWRDRLLEAGPAALAEFSAETGTASLAETERLLARLARPLPEAAERRLRRELFRAIHAALSTAVQNGGRNR